MRLLSLQMRPGPVLLALVAACGAGEPEKGSPPPADPYVPAAPFPYDERYLQGSFEDAQGFGWDTCHSRTPGTRIQVLEGSASNGQRSAVFASGDCSVCSPENPSLSQAYFWFDGPVPAGKVGFYFDVRNLQAQAPTGALRIYGTDNGCEQEALLAEVPLGALAPPSAWSTRCVTLDGVSVHQAIGIATAEGAFEVGIDALRLGPVCQP